VSEPSPGLDLDLATGGDPDLAPAAGGAGGAWGSLREVKPSLLLRLLPGMLRAAFAGREPVGGLPVVEPGRGRSRGLELADVDFGDSAPTSGQDYLWSVPDVELAEAAAEPLTEAEGVAEADVIEAQAEAVIEIQADVLDLADVADVGAAGPAAASSAAATAEVSTLDAVAEIGEVGW
jgi:hypothetical protein